MATPVGYSDVSIWLSLSTSTRPSAITFGVASGTKTSLQVWNEVTGSLAVTGSPKTIFCSLCTFSRVRVSTGADGGPDVVTDAPTATTCTGGTLFVTPNVAVLVHKRTAEGGARGRGRFFLPWAVKEADVTENGGLVPATVTALSTTLNTWLTDLTSRGIPMHVLHQPGDTPAGAPTPVTSLSVDALVSTQRRRLGR